jgi:hypothetical protein
MPVLLTFGHHTSGHSNQPITEHPTDTGLGKELSEFEGTATPRDPPVMGEAPPSMVPLLPTAVVFRHRRRLGLTTRAASRYSQLSDRTDHSHGTMDDGINRPPDAVLPGVQVGRCVPGSHYEKSRQG